ncbi:MAG: GTPase ObgE [bacterium]
MFVDKVTITVRGGRGGDGCLAFRREKFVPNGGPSGGNGGRGGDVILEASQHLDTLVGFTYKKLFEAAAGKPGQGSDMTGAEGQDLIVMVPKGTVVYRRDGHDSPRQGALADLVNPGQRIVVAKGGRSGRGNASFTTSTHRAPRLAERGDPGEEVELTLELLLFADIGLIGKPNAGKSTLLGALSAAAPKVADYPFTTIQPVLGVITLPDHQQAVLAEIPGLIEGASQGAGLGHLFLRHAMRTRVLAYLLDLSGDPLEDFTTLRQEVSRYDTLLAQRPALVVLTKEDLSSPAEVLRITTLLSEFGLFVLSTSALARTHLEDLRQALQAALATAPLVPTQAPTRRLYTLQADDERAMQVRRLGEGLFQVEGLVAERLVARTDLDNEEGVKRLQKQLVRLGVERELRKLGVKDGDIVRIGADEFDYRQEEGSGDR